MFFLINSNFLHLLQLEIEENFNKKRKLNLMNTDKDDNLDLEIIGNENVEYSMIIFH